MAAPTGNHNWEQSRVPLPRPDNSQWFWSRGAGVLTFPATPLASFHPEPMRSATTSIARTSVTLTILALCLLLVLAIVF